VPKWDRRMRLGSAAIAKNGKIDVIPMTWNRACVNENVNTKPSFALPYGRAKKRNATNQINVMSKPGQGVVTRSRKLAHEIPLAVANYLREKLRCQKTPKP